MEHFGRVIGIDVGSKRVGLARSDLLKTSANPVGTFSPEESIDKIRLMAEEYPVDVFVVGWPLSLDGSRNDATKMVEAYIQKLNSHFPGVSVYKMDERNSSKQAVQTLIHTGVPQKKRSKKGRVDQVVASLLLQQYLEIKEK